MNEWLSTFAVLLPAAPEINLGSRFMHLKMVGVLTIVVVFTSQAVAAGSGGLWSVMVDDDLARGAGRNIARQVAQSGAHNIDETIAKINKNMPSKVDGMTTLTGLRRSERTIIYEFVFNVHHSKLTIEARKDLRKKVIALMCGDSDYVNYMRNGNEFLYKYNSLNGDLLLGQKVSMRYCQS
jgi:hypothetical protein